MENIKQSVAHVTADSVEVDGKQRKGPSSKKKHLKSRALKSYQQYRGDVMSELNRSCIEPFSFEVYKKTKHEREQLKILKSANKQAILNAGKDPKKDLNP